MTPLTSKCSYIVMMKPLEKVNEVYTIMYSQVEEIKSKIHKNRRKTSRANIDKFSQHSSYFWMKMLLSQLSRRQKILSVLVISVACAAIVGIALIVHFSKRHSSE
ncbi:unnamed protein product [Schistosoma bovis]|nr:unnamed protein product [Schistosoma bovis]